MFKYKAAWLPWVVGCVTGLIAFPVTAAESTEPGDESGKDFWSFQPIKSPPVPEVQSPAWVKTPIDAFILQKLEASGLSPAPPADKVALLRRAYYDLTGLPPSPAEVDAFLKDTSPNAFRDVVDRLLSSPRYGERWGRHWLDVVRFAETNSFERDSGKPFAWRYRDYVIRSLNNDKPYDRFILEQLAGDELDEVTADSLIATGYYRLGAWDDEPTDRLQAYYDELDDMLATTSQAFLGLTMNCARCHDHKLDPIPQADYYRMLAFLHGITPYGVAKKAAEKHILRPLPGTKDEKVLCVTEKGGQAPDTFVLVRGNAHAQGQKVVPAFPTALGGLAPTIPSRSADAPSSGRRRALAEWIASTDNPLTARVMVNRIWQHHFGRGIVRSPNNFGRIGDRPTHPEPLDWLARAFVDRGWRLKDMHRLIMNSSTYQMASIGNADALAQDPTNDRFWRMNMRRLSAEEIRDSILAVTGLLNLKAGGPGVYPTIPQSILAGQSQPGNGWGKSSLEERSRRSVYVHVKRSLLVPILASFDAADTDMSCPVRFVTTQATQALGMLNSDFINEMAEVFAERLRREAGDDAHEQVRWALNLALSRPPTDEEVRRGKRLIEDLGREPATSAELALSQFCLMVLSLNEFVYLD